MTEAAGSFAGSLAAMVIGIVLLWLMRPQRTMRRRPPDDWPPPRPLGRHAYRERHRIEAICALVKANRLRSTDGLGWIHRGTSLDLVAADVLEILKERGHEAKQRGSA